jgi:hypothetical protein
LLPESFRHKNAAASNICSPVYITAEFCYKTITLINRIGAFTKLFSAGNIAEIPSYVPILCTERRYQYGKNYSRKDL